MSREVGVLARHKELVQTLSFILQSFYKHKQLGSVPDKTQVLLDYIRFKGLGPVLHQLRTPAAQVVQKQRGGRGEKPGGGAQQRQ